MPTKYAHSITDRTDATRRWASPEQACEYMGGLSIRSLRRMIAAGVIPAHRVGSRLIRIDLNDVDDAMQPIPSGAA